MDACAPQGAPNQLVEGININWRGKIDGQNRVFRRRRTWNSDGSRQMKSLRTNPVPREG